MKKYLIIEGKEKDIRNAIDNMNNVEVKEFSNSCNLYFNEEAEFFINQLNNEEGYNIELSKEDIDKLVEAYINEDSSYINENRIDDAREIFKRFKK